MAYTVKELTQLSGVSVRTLHYYDEIDLLKPAFLGDNGFDRKQQEKYVEELKERYGKQAEDLIEESNKNTKN